MSCEWENLFDKIWEKCRFKAIFLHSSIHILLHIYCIFYSNIFILMRIYSIQKMMLLKGNTVLQHCCILMALLYKRNVIHKIFSQVMFLQSSHCFATITWRKNCFLSVLISSLEDITKPRLQAASMGVFLIVQKNLCI